MRGSGGWVLGFSWPAEMEVSEVRGMSDQAKSTSAMQTLNV